jgi:hypothetical protein
LAQKTTAFSVIYVKGAARYLRGLLIKADQFIF